MHSARACFANAAPDDALTRCRPEYDSDDGCGAGAAPARGAAAAGAASSAAAAGAAPIDVEEANYLTNVMKALADVDEDGEEVSVDEALDPDHTYLPTYPPTYLAPASAGASTLYPGLPNRPHFNVHDFFEFASNPDFRAACYEYNEEAERRWLHPATQTQLKLSRSAVIESLKNKKKKLDHKKAAVMQYPVPEDCTLGLALACHDGEGKVLPPSTVLFRTGPEADAEPIPRKTVGAVLRLWQVLQGHDPSRTQVNSLRKMALGKFASEGGIEAAKVGAGHKSDAVTFAHYLTLDGAGGANARVVAAQRNLAVSAAPSSLQARQAELLQRFGVAAVAQAPAAGAAVFGRDMARGARAMQEDTFKEMQASNLEWMKQTGLSGTDTEYGRLMIATQISWLAVTGMRYTCVMGFTVGEVWDAATGKVRAQVQSNIHKVSASMLRPIPARNFTHLPTFLPHTTPLVPTHRSAPFRTRRCSRRCRTSCARTTPLSWCRTTSCSSWASPTARPSTTAWTRF